MHVYWEVWKLLLQLNNKERFQDGIKIIKRKIYEVYGFCAARSQYNQIIQESLPESTKFIINKEYITQEKGYISNYLQ